MSTFTPPASSSGISWGEMNGHLLLITPSGVEEHIPTSLGEKDAVRATITDLDTGEVYEDALIFPRVLQGQLRSRVGQQVLGRLTQGAAKPGQNPPWVLRDFTPEDAEKATRWLQKQQQGRFRNPNTEDAPF